MNAKTLREKREKFGLTQEMLAQMLHSSRKTINSYENGSNIPDSKIALIESIFSSLESKSGLNVDTSADEMLKNITKDEVKPVPYENYMEVEYAKLSTVAGKLGFENPATLPETRKKLIPREFDSGNYLVVEVDGDSMDDGTNISIPDGSDILIKEYMLNAGEKLPIRGNLFVIVTTEGTVFKQIVEHNIEEGYIMCHSYNPKYKDYKINVVDIIQIFIYRKIVSVRPSIPEI